MPVGPTLATYSDWCYAAALVIYVGALLLHAAHLAVTRTPRHERAPELAAVGAGSGPADAVDVTSVQLDAARCWSGRTPGPPGTSTEPGRADRLERMAVALTVLAALVHAGSLVLRGLAVERVPWSNMYEFGSAICLVAIVTWLVVLRRQPVQRLGMFVLLPIVLLLFTSGTLLYTKATPLGPPLQSYWITIHVSAVIIATGVLLVAGVASLLYLARGAHDGDPARFARIGQRLPAADVLDRLAYRATVFAFPVWTFAIITGAVWAEAAWGRYWGWDPKETVAFVAWVIYAGYLHARATAGWRSGLAAWVNVAGLAVMVFNLFFVNLVIAGLHSYAKGG
jgi:cytochrome c-type biogenesis protein CcsB